MADRKSRLAALKQKRDGAKRKRGGEEEDNEAYVFRHSQKIRMPHAAQAPPPVSHEATPSPATSAHSSARPHVHTPSPRLCLSSAPPRPEPKITFRNYQPRDDDLKDQQLEPTLAVVVATDKDAAKEEKTAELEAAEVRRDV